MVGFGSLSVDKKAKYQGQAHLVFETKASTGDWYSFIFEAKDSAKAIVSLQDFSISYFEINQWEKKMFKDPLSRKKYLSFKHEKCEVEEKTIDEGKQAVVVQSFLEPGAADVLGALFKLRSLNYIIGKVETLWFIHQKKTGF